MDLKKQLRGREVDDRLVILGLISPEIDRWLDEAFYRALR